MRIELLRVEQRKKYLAPNILLFSVISLLIVLFIFQNSLQMSFGIPLYISGFFQSTTADMNTAITEGEAKADRDITDMGEMSIEALLSNELAAKVPVETFLNNESELNNENGEATSLVNEEKDSNKKVAYLTFDDGPTREVTPKILDILAQRNIKATFFVLGNLSEINKDILLRASQEGHTICNHTYSHNYKTLYSSPQAFLKDLRKCDEVLKNILGDNYSSKTIRFPGGTMGRKLGDYIKAAEDAGYGYIDWNVESGDATGKNVPVEKQLEKVKATIEGKDDAIVLMHDSYDKQNTVAALQLILDYLDSQGYTYKTIQ